MDKQTILQEIRRTARLNDDAPLGRDRFEAETGIKQSDWYGKHWRSWGEAVAEAGFKPNKLNERLSDEEVILHFIKLARELGAYPVAADFRMKARRTPGFPSHTTFSRVGKKSILARKVLDYCQDLEEFADIVGLCEPVAAPEIIEIEHDSEGSPKMGFVYLLKSDRNYKIGRTNSVGRREYELKIQLPTKASIVHKIKTDDPEGIEDYWHRRFAGKRLNGEWFGLSPADVKAFKRRKFM